METRNLSHSLKWHFDFNHPVERVWPLVSNTDRMNQAVGLSNVDYRSEPSHLGGSARFGEAKIAGFQLKWHEHPYEWVLHDYFRVQRDYTNGPLKAMDISWKLEPTESGCRLIQTVVFGPKSFFFSIVSHMQIHFFTKRAFLRAYKNIEGHLNKNRPSPFATSMSAKPRVNKPLFKEVVKQLGEVNVTGVLADKMTNHIFESNQADLVRIKPFVLASQWSQERLEVLSAFLRGTNRGIFTLYWDLVCPRCQGAKKRLTSLAGLKEQVHCDSCNIDFKAQFDKSVEVTFSVHPRFRKVNVGEYCVGGPQNTPHFALQLRLAPKESHTVSICLPEGIYRVRSLQSKGWRLLEIKKDLATHSPEISVTFNNIPTEEEERTQLKVEPINLKLVNEQRHEIVVTVNRVSWMEDVCTAAFVTSLQEFKNRFASEVLDPNQEISVSRIALLFTDLKGSTKMYQDIGDAKAYKFVRNHFEILTQIIMDNEGALVKTLGDAIMAAFSSPAAALTAAIEMQQKMKQSEMLDGNTKMKIGIHVGSCFVINGDGKLDYFGTNVNIAARTNGQCEGDDIIITQYMMNDPDVQKLVEASGLPCSKVVRDLKGFDNHFILYQIKCGEGRRISRVS